MKNKVLLFVLVAGMFLPACKKSTVSSGTLPSAVYTSSITIVGEPVASPSPVAAPSVAATTENNIVVVIKSTAELPVAVQLHAPGTRQDPTVIPSDLSVPNQVTGLTDTGFGVYKSKPGWQFTGHQIVMLRYPTKAKYGQTITEDYTVQGFIDFSGKDANLKIHRLWPEGTNYVNVYEGQSPGTQECHLFAENMTVVNGVTYAQTHPHMDYTLVKAMFNGQPHHVVRTMKLPSGQGRTDGRYTLTVDGQTAIDLLHWQVNDAAHPAIPNVVNIQVDISNHQQPSSAYVNFSNVKVSVK